MEGNAIAFVCLSVCLIPLYILNQVSFELDLFACVWLTTIDVMGLKVKGQG